MFYTLIVPTLTKQKIDHTAVKAQRVTKAITHTESKNS